MTSKNDSVDHMDFELTLQLTLFVCLHLVSTISI